MAREFTLPDNPTPLQLNQSLTECANNIARLSDLVASYKADVAIKTTAYKRAYARATVKYSSAKNATLIKAMSDIDEDVTKAQDVMDTATAVYTIALGEIEGYDSQFVALRKIVEVRKMEVRGGIG